MNLSVTQKKYLRGLGHALKPVITVGDAGVTESLLKEFMTTLDHHELIKVRVRATSRETRDEIIARLCAEGSASLVQRIGNVALLYRPNLRKRLEKRIRLPSG
ncbi:MAG: ribosome assembly RNA-binding protein YhbY [Gammaproteobacteria bacterium]|nr:ribosome assembly RNA-binding protein YhbY [Gammaproteobacteria bacterium]